MNKAIAGFLILCVGISPLGTTESVVVSEPVNTISPVITVTATRISDFYQTPSSPCSADYSKERHEIEYLGKLDCALARAGAS